MEIPTRIDALIQALTKRALTPRERERYIRELDQLLDQFVTTACRGLI